MPQRKQFVESSIVHRNLFYAAFGVLLLTLVLFGLFLWQQFHLPPPIVSEIKGNAELRSQMALFVQRVEAAEQTLRWAANIFGIAGLVITAVSALIGIIGFFRLEQISILQKEVKEQATEYERLKNEFRRNEVLRFQEEEFWTDEKLFGDYSDLEILTPRGWELAKARDRAFRDLFTLRILAMIGNVTGRQWNVLASYFHRIGMPGLAAARYLEAAELEQDAKKRAVYYLNSAIALVAVYEEDRHEQIAKGIEKVEDTFHIPSIERALSSLKTAMSYHPEYPTIRFWLAYVIDDLNTASPGRTSDVEFSYEAALDHLDYC